MLKFILIGCGRIGERHAAIMAERGQLVAVCDTDQEKAQQLANKYQATPYFNLDKLLENKVEADIAAICTPNYLHATHSISAMKSGYHVICEKPMALSVYDCGQMIKVADECQRRLFIVKQNRYNPPVVALRNWIESGKLGKILSVQLSCNWNRNAAYYQSPWKGSKARDGGILYTQFSHFIDLIYWLVGDVKSVKSLQGNLSQRQDIEFEDSLVALCEFYNGALGAMHFTINSYKKNMEGSLTIFGEKGTVKIGGQYLNTLEYKEIEAVAEIKLPNGNPPNEYGSYQGSMSNHHLVYDNVVDVLTNNGLIATNGFEGLKTIEIIDKIYSSVND